MDTSNTNSDDAEIQYSIVKFEIPPPISERSIPVPESNWAHLASRINSIEEIGIYFNIASGIFVGIMITAIAAAFTLGIGHQYFWPFIIAGIAGFVCTILCLFFASRLNRCTNAHKADILDEMQLLKNRYIRSPDVPQ